MNVNWFLVRGLEQAGLTAEAKQLAGAHDRPRLALRVRRVLRTDDGRAARRPGLLVERGADDRPPAAPAGVSYDANPRYPVVGGAVESGFEPLWPPRSPGSDRAWSPSTGRRHCPGTRLPHALADALAAHDVDVELEDARRSFVVVGRDRAAHVRDRAAGRSRLRADLRGRARRPGRAAAERPRARNGTTVVFGPGSALHAHDRLWYADVPKSAEPRAGPEGARRERRPDRRARRARSSGSSSSTGRCSTVTSRSSSRGSIAISTSATRQPRARSEARLSASRSGPSRRGRSASGRPSCPGRGAASGYDAGSGSRPTRRTSRGPTS